MISKHIKRDFSSHKKTTYRPYDEYVKLEIFSFDHKKTRMYIPEFDTLTAGSNATRTSWKSWACFKSTDGQNPMEFTIDYSAVDDAEYRIDILYEVSNQIYGDKRDTSDLLVGNMRIFSSEGLLITEEDIKFSGVNNVTKRIQQFKHLIEGDYQIVVRIPHNCYALGFIVRKVKTFVADNYYGNSLGSEEGNIVLTSATYSLGGMTKPAELSCDIFYDDDLLCNSSGSGFYIDYMDEVNFYVKDDSRNIVRVFGGYISSILPNSDGTKLSIHCADRLADGQQKYVLDQMVMLGGTKDKQDIEYRNGMIRSFNTYPQALQYLCYVHETTLKSNVSKNYTVDGEKYQQGIQLTYGSKKKITDIKTNEKENKEVTPNYIMLRNSSSSLKKQVWTVYDAKKYSKLPPEFTDTPYLHITYGLGSPKTDSKSDETVESENSTGAQSFNKCGVSSDGKYLLAIGLPSAGKDSHSGWTKAVFNRKCPHCGSNNMVWDWNWGSYSSCRGAHEGGTAEGHIFCKSCDADYAVQGHEHISGSRYHMEPISGIQSSSRAEAQQLKNGGMTATVDGTTTETKTVTTTWGYDKDKPFQAYIRLTYSTEQSYDAKLYDLYIKFTQPATAHNQSINTGLDLFWINNVVKKVKLDKNITSFLRVQHQNEDARFFLHYIQFIAPVKEEDDGVWYKTDDTTIDNSSCKMNLYQIFLDNYDGATPSDLNSCGKTVNNVMEDIVKDAGYYVNIKYGLHRKDDIINFRVNNQSKESFVASEGDNNNILSWNSISYNPLNSLHNMSMQVFKQEDNKYYYVDSRSPQSILMYGEHCDLQTSSQVITPKEAYYNCVMSDNFSPLQTYSYTITVPNYPNLKIGQLVKVVANAKKLNALKEIQSIKIVFDTGKMPRVQTTLGLDELDPDAQLKKNIREIKLNTKRESTAFGSSAIPISDEIYYEWDR